MLSKLIACIRNFGAKKAQPKMANKAPVIVVSDLAKFQVEAEHGIRAIDTMTSFYGKHNGHVDEEFTAHCIVLMQTLKGTIERLSLASQAAKQGEQK